MAKQNPRTGSAFDAFLKEEGICDDVQAKALIRALVEQRAEGMEASVLNTAELARRMGTSRSRLARLLDPDETSVRLEALIGAAHVLGKVVEIRIKRQTKTAC